MHLKQSNKMTFQKRNVETNFSQHFVRDIMQNYYFWGKLVCFEQTHPLLMYWKSYYPVNTLDELLDLPILGNSLNLCVRFKSNEVEYIHRLNWNEDIHYLAVSYWIVVRTIRIQGIHKNPPSNYFLSAYLGFGNDCPLPWHYNS